MTQNKPKTGLKIQILELVSLLVTFVTLVLIGTAFANPDIPWLGAIGIAFFMAGQYLVNWLRLRRLGFGTPAISRPNTILARPKTKQRFEQVNKYNRTARTFGIMAGGFPVILMLWSYPYVIKQIKLNHLNPVPVLISAMAVLIVCLIVSWWSLIMSAAIEKGNNYVELLPEGLKIFGPAGLGVMRPQQPIMIHWEDLVAVKLNAGLWPWGMTLEIIAKDKTTHQPRIWWLNSLMFEVKTIYQALAQIVSLNEKGIINKQSNDH